MDFNLTEEQRMLRDGAQRFIRQHYGFERRRNPGMAVGEFRAANWRSYAELGWLALSLPEDAGGFGCGFVDTALLAIELGRGLILEPFVGTAVLAARIIDRSGVPELRNSLLPAIGEGGLQVALAYLERDGRYDPAAVATTAIATDGGFRLEGEKLMALGAPAADHLIVTARLGGGIALFLVPRTAAGLRLRPYALIDGTEAADVLLSDVVLERTALLAGPETAMALLEDGLDHAVLAQVAEGLGAMEAVLDLTADYLKTRRQFGQPIGRFQSLQHRMAEMLVKVEDTRSMLYRGIAHLDAPPAERRRAVSAAKVVAAEAGAFVGGQGIQLHGGIGVTDEHSISHYFKKLLTLEKSYGDVDWHLARFAA
jgi:alkylation response protein AidB-like acyl-CoA dehydrogenase